MQERARSEAEKGLENSPNNFASGSNVNQKMVVARIKEIMHCYHETLVPYPKEIEQLAQLFAKQLIAKKALKASMSEVSNETNPANNKDFVSVNLNNVVHSNCRTIGLELGGLLSEKRRGF